MRRNVLILVPLALLLVGAWGSSAHAAGGDAGKQKVDWGFDGQIRFRWEYRDNSDLDSSEDDRQNFTLSRVRVGFKIQVPENFQVYVQVQDSRTFGQEESTASNEANVDLHQGYLIWGQQGAPGWWVQIGRQEWIYGNERMIGALAWSNVGRSFDGVRVRFRRSFWIDGIAATVSQEVTDSGGTTGSSLFGVYAHVPASPKGAYEGYLLVFADAVDMEGETGAFGDTSVRALGGRAKNRYESVPLDYEIEIAVERGDVHGDDLNAHAFAVVVGWTLDGDVKWRPFAGYDFATGDKDPMDGKTEQFFNFFPTNHKHYGYMDLFGWRNIRSYYFGARASWGRQWAQAKFHRLSLESEFGPWQSAGGTVLGFDPTGASGRSVGWEMDLNYNFAIRKKISVQGGYSLFEPGRFARDTRGPDTQHWAYVMFILGF